MSALDEDSSLATVYESSATLFSASESASLYSSNNGDVMAGPPSEVTNSESMMSKTKAPCVLLSTSFPDADFMPFNYDLAVFVNE